MKWLNVSEMVKRTKFDRSYIIRQCEAGENGGIPAFRAGDVMGVKLTNSANHWLVTEDDFLEWMNNPRRGSMSKPKKGITNATE